MSEKEYSFAVIGDFHYAKRKHYPKNLPGECKVIIYQWMVKHILKPMLSEIKTSCPDFIVQTGDFIEGMIKNQRKAREQLKEALELLSSAKVPVYISVGGHEKYTIPRKSYKSIVIPFLSQQLNRNIKSHYFSFDYKGDRFIFLDTQGLKKDTPQARWFEKELKNYKKRGHIFVFGHMPVFLIGRVFFSEIGFIQLMLDLLKKFPIDAYFCGHTHNQSVLVTKKEKILQIMGTAVGFLKDRLSPSEVRKMENLPSGTSYYIPEEELIPLEETKTPLLPRHLLNYYWGYLEDTAPGWYLVKVKEKNVTVEWHFTGSGIRRVFFWEKPGEVKEIKIFREEIKKKKISKTDLNKIKSAYLYSSLWNSKGGEKEVFLNGEKIGFLPAGTFYSTQRLEIPKNKMSSINLTNQIRITNPNKEKFCIGSIYMEITLKNGVKVRSNVSQHIYATSKRWNNWKLSILRYVPPGKDIFQEINFVRN